MAVAFIDDRNAPVTLGRELGRGGEGSVYELAGTNLVAKIYHRAAEQPKAEKLEAMVRLRAANLAAIASSISARETTLSLDHRVAPPTSMYSMKRTSAPIARP